MPLNYAWWGSLRSTHPTIFHIPRPSTMRILALETTENIGSVAASDDANLLAELQLDSQSRSAASARPRHPIRPKNRRLAA